VALQIARIVQDTQDLDNPLVRAVDDEVARSIYSA
jgi:hypothetical protein